MYRLFCSMLLCLGSITGHTAELALPTDGSNVVGQVYYEELAGGKSLASVARDYQIGVEQLAAANKSISLYKSLKKGARVLIPSAFVLPPGPRKGIIINLAEQRLYYFPTDRAVVFTEPVGIGRGGKWQTPIGTTKVTAKQQYPSWRPTESVRLEAARVGTPIPDVFPPGPANPLGDYVLRLGWPTYLIHGTNQPDAVGSRVSAGCIRMFPEGIEALFAMVPVGTPVRVINQPIKLGYYQGTYVLEVHGEAVPTSPNLVNKISKLVMREGGWVSWSRIGQVLTNHQGFPQAIGKIDKNVDQIKT